MKKLKIALQSNIGIISLIIISITYCLVYYNKKIEVKEEYKIIGIIEKIEKTDNYINLYIKTKKNKYLLKTKENLEYKLGYKVESYGKTTIPQKNTLPNIFNYQNYLKSKKIFQIFYAEKIKIIDKKINIIYLIKNKLYDKMDSNKNTNKYLRTFILGDNSLIEDNILESYSNNGISHLFSLSGMHISIFSSILFFILNKIFKKENIIYLLIIFFLLFYLILTGFLVSLIRAVLMYIFGFINKKYKLNIKTYKQILILFFILLIYNPYYIYNQGFLFSFIISFFLIIFSKKINNKKTYIKKLITTSYISFLVSIPILINNFHSINLLTPLYNLIFVPLISIIIFPLSLLTFIIPQLNPIFELSINVLQSLSLILNKISIFEIKLSHINLIIIVIYYILIILTINKKRNIIYLIILIILIIIHYNISVINFNTRITFLDVGQGDSTLINLPHNQSNILIDTGGIINSNYSITKNKIVPYLKSIGIHKIEYLILTHGDYDHMGESMNLVNNFKVEKVIFNCGPYNDLEKELIKILDKKKIKYYSCIRELNIDKNKLYFLQTKEYDNENDNSNVIYTELNGYKFMFMGDASSITEKEILDKYNLPDIDVLKAGHHGSKTSSSKEFIDEINPRYSIISVGKNNRYGHPNKEVLENLRDSKIYRTDQDGSIMFKIKNNRLKIETCGP